jgi:hypothetical protein
MSVPLPWASANKVLGVIGRRPILTLWIGLNLVLLVWWRVFEPVADAERLEHQLTFLGIVNLLDWPGSWITRAWLAVVELLSSFVRGRESRPLLLGGQGVLVVWLLSAAITWAFWELIAVPAARRVDRWVESRRDPYLR